MSEKINIEEALMAIDDASVCLEYKAFARSVIQALGREAPAIPAIPAIPDFKVGDIVEVTGDFMGLGGRRGIMLGTVKLIYASDFGSVEFFEPVPNGHNDCGGKDGYVYNLDIHRLKLIHRPSLNITAKL